MNCELRKLSPEDGVEVYDFLQRLPALENGFINEMRGKTYGEYQAWLVRQDQSAKQTGLADGWRVPTTTYWLFADGRPVGIGKVRHFLTDRLREEGGSLGYAICPNERGKGYGTALLRALLKEAEQRRLGKVLLTIRTNNTPSIRLALSCGGTIERTNDVRHYIWIDC